MSHHFPVPWAGPNLPSDS